MLLIGSSLGLLFGFFLDEYTSMVVPLPYFIMVFLFGGASLILFYYVENKKKANLDE